MTFKFNPLSGRLDLDGGANGAVGGTGPTGPAGATGAAGAAGATGPSGAPFFGTKITTGTLASPAASVDITLPGGYDLFWLHLTDFTAPSATGGKDDYIVAALSFDGGTTYLNDLTNNDSYYSDGSGTKPVIEINLVNGFLADTTNNFIFGRMYFSPGSATEVPAFDFSFISSMAGGAVSIAPGISAVNPSATVAFTKARATTIRIFPYGSTGSANTLSGQNLRVGAKWALFGMAVY